MESWFTLPNIFMFAIAVGVIAWALKMVKDRPEKAKKIFEDPLDNALTYLQTLPGTDARVDEAIAKLRDVQLVKSASASLNAPNNVVGLMLDKLSNIDNRLKALEQKK